MLSEWEIKARSRYCARTHESFEDGATIYTLLFRERTGFRREDISEPAWQQIKEGIKPFSFWKSKFQAAPPAAPEPLPKESVEELLRRLVTEDLPEHLNARYVLAILLERKRTLKQVDIRESPEEKILIYEHLKTGEVFIILGSMGYLEISANRAAASRVTGADKGSDVLLGIGEGAASITPPAQ